MAFYTKLVFALVFFLWIFSFTEANAERSDVAISAELIHNDSIYSQYRVHSLTRHLDSTPSFNGSVIMANPSMQNYLMQIYLGTPRTSIWLVIDTTNDYPPKIVTNYCVSSNDAVYFICAKGYYFLRSSTSKRVSCHNPFCLGSYWTCNVDQICITPSNPIDAVVADDISFSPSPSFPTYNFYYENIEDNVNGIVWGFMSLGNHSYSLINQLNVTTFAYCLPPLNSNNNGTINFEFNGEEIIGTRVQIVSTPLTTQVPPEQNNHLYFMTLLGINIGLGYTKINFPDETPYGDGNIVIDPSTFETSLPPEMVDKIVISLQKHIPCPRAPDVETANHLRLCYNASSCSFEPPMVVASFVGGNLCLPWNNLFTEIQEGVQCLTVVNTTSYATWGSALQVGFTIEYNLAHQYIKFKPGGC